MVPHGLVPFLGQAEVGDLLFEQLHARARRVVRCAGADLCLTAGVLTEAHIQAPAVDGRKIAH